MKLSTNVIGIANPDLGNFRLPYVTFSNRYLTRTSALIRPSRRLNLLAEQKLVDVGDDFQGLHNGG